MPTMHADELVQVFAENVRRHRLALGLSQRELADKLGVHPPYISDLERGKKTPQLGGLARLAEALDTTPDMLLVRP